jgi:hypothetical protein
MGLVKLQKSHDSKASRQSFQTHTRGTRSLVGKSAFVVIGHFANDKAELFTRRHLTSNLFKPTNLLLLSTPGTYCHPLPIISPSS